MLNGFWMENHFQLVCLHLFNYIFHFWLLYLDEHFEIQAKGPVHTLTIRKVAWNEGGEYKCVADGGAKTSATLIVKGNLIFVINRTILNHKSTLSFKRGTLN
jgi:hypothetical protein